MQKVYIISACRTPIGKMGGTLSEIPASELGAVVIRESTNRAKLSSSSIDHVYFGCVIQAGLGQNIARQCAVKAGLPYETTATTLNAVCGSGLDAVNHAAMLIQSGSADIVVAGGVESMSRAPFAVMKGRFGFRMGYPMGKSELVDTMVNDALWDVYGDYHMGITAENVAEKYDVSREEMDVFAADSQNKACQAREKGYFQDEIVPVKLMGRGGETKIDFDEGPRPGTTVESLAKLKPVFKENGSVTAGNASGINDGAAAVLLASEEKVRELNLTPLAEWLGGAMAGVDPAVMGIAPVYSSKKLLEKLRMNLDDVDLVEANEAFAAQSIAVSRELALKPEKLNVHGGAIALGHPVGASGCRILVTLLYAMRRRGAETGLATLCIGGGMGSSTMVRLCH